MPIEVWTHERAENRDLVDADGHSYVSIMADTGMVGRRAFSSAVRCSMEC